ncbi:unnamed protein product [Blepharisma stoltei]|uniref:Uncharacterized protein n=1 Tax=Blepharisma stoltei TaxID=1481888 RepID=A0AAU9K1F0_9CILI|nr:unnamed protein product [Blepharisma stoltei]
MHTDISPFKTQKATVSSLLMSIKLKNRNKIKHNRETSLEEPLFAVSQGGKKYSKNSPYKADYSLIFQPPKYDLEKVFNFHDMQQDLDYLLMPKRSSSSATYTKKTNIRAKSPDCNIFNQKSSKGFSLEATVRQITPGRRICGNIFKPKNEWSTIKIKHMNRFHIARIPTVKLDSD